MAQQKPFPRTAPEGEERVALAYSGFVRAGEPIWKHIHCPLLTREFLHLLKPLLIAIW